MTCKNCKFWKREKDTAHPMFGPIKANPGAGYCHNIEVDIYSIGSFHPPEAFGCLKFKKKDN